ncbi:MAG: threonine ammonia-lyase [Deltaproteobacteria bacterium]|nr:threonine ammonia-lyase [Deltaproteobacteria bacterium]
MTVTFADIEAARHRIKDSVKRTPCNISPWMSEARGAEIFLKLENHQHTGSFKERGALNRLLLLSDEERRRGVIAASAGNHAQGVALHASRLGIEATIVMPIGTPLIKVVRTQDFGAKVVLFGQTYDEAYEKAAELRVEKNLFFVHAYDDDGVIAGQGTVGLELIEQNPYIEVVVVPVGGGGLISGIAVAMKKVRPHVRIVGVEASVLASMKASVDAGKRVVLPAHSTIADGIAVSKVGERPFAIARDLVDDFVTVDDDEIARAILYLLEREKTVAEGAGAAGVAAILAERIPDIKGKKVAVVVGGGNIDVNIISRIIERGLAETGRLARLDVTIRDTPGALSGMLKTVANARANVVAVHHERAFAGGALNQVRVELVLESRGHAHVDDVITALEAEGYYAQRNGH